MKRYTKAECKEANIRSCVLDGNSIVYIYSDGYTETTTFDSFGDAEYIFNRGRSIIQEAINPHGYCGQEPDTPADCF